MSKLRTIAWTEQPNLGDRFTSLWLDARGVEHTVTNHLAEGNFVGVGSLLEQVGGHAVTIWGTGRASDPRRIAHVDLTKATVLALRGKFSSMGAYGALAAVNLRQGFVLGDPGLLADDVLNSLMRPAPGVIFERYEVIVPHWQDQERMKAKYPTAKFVDLLGDPFEALWMISQADAVISSSLHGLVFADAFGIARRWEWFDGIQHEGFKFRDYGSVMGQFEPDDIVKVADSRVRTVQSDLRGVFDQWAMNNA